MDATTGHGMAAEGRTPGGREGGRTANLRRWAVRALALMAGALALAACSRSVVADGPAATPTAGVPAGATALETTIESVIRQVQPSVVEVHSAGGGPGGAIGSGNVLTADGYIVTNDHVVAGFKSYQVQLSSGKTLAARLVGEAPNDDLAVLKVNQTGLRPIAVGDSSKVQVGQFVLAIGNPLGLNESVTFGIVSALNRTASEAPNGPAGTLTGLIQTSAPINPGNSGGALVNLQGQLIGIPTLGAVNPETGGIADGIGYAIPSNRMRYVTQQLIKSGHVTSTGQGFLGIQGEDVTPQLAQANNLPVDHGVLITGFANDAAGKSPAQQAGLQASDVITAVNGAVINTSGDLAGALQAAAPGTKVGVTVQRGTSSKTVQVTLGERPTSVGG
jgi:S1-C subfamily serine protease